MAPPTQSDHETQPPVTEPQSPNSRLGPVGKRLVAAWSAFCIVSIGFDIARIVKSGHAADLGSWPVFRVLSTWVFIWLVPVFLLWIAALWRREWRRTRDSS